VRNTPTHPSVLIALILILAVSCSAQTVSTIVTGPSTFDDALVLDGDGNIYGSFYSGAVVTRITPGGETSIFADGLSSPNGTVFDDDGNLWVPSAGGNRIDMITPEGVSTTVVTDIANPSGLLFDHDGNLIIAQYSPNLVSIMNTDGEVSTYIDDPLLNGPVGLQMDDEGVLYIGNFTDGKVLKRDPGGELRAIADLPGWLGFIALTDQAIYATAFQRHQIYKVPLDGGTATVIAGTGAAGQRDGEADQATFNGPNGIVATATGDTLYVSDYQTRSLRMITGLNTTTGVADQDELPDFENLVQTYPNPFNPTTTISYRLPRDSQVQLRVYDIRGQLVSNLVSQWQERGDHRVEFHAEGLSSGVYFTHLQADGLDVTRKMVLTK